MANITCQDTPMLFVPLTLFATISLCLILAVMLRVSDLRVTANRLFAGVVALYAMQSLLLTLRWGYGFEQFAFWVAILAPLLPVCALAAYLSLQQRLTPRRLWFVAVIPLAWLTRLVAYDLYDAALIVIFVGFGVALLRMARRGSDALPLASMVGALDSVRAMGVTGITLVLSGVVDLFVIVDFIKTGGANVGMIVTIVQTLFLIAVGFGAYVGQRSAVTHDEPEAPATPAPSETDAAIVTRLEGLFHQEALHQDTDLNLRRLARKLGVPDRAVSQAINRTKGESVSQFVNRFRITEACAEIAKGEMSILQISLAVGFLSKSNFNREFSRITGETPTGWRNAQAAKMR